MRTAWLSAVLAFASFAQAGEPTWHLSFQLYSFHEHTTEADLRNDTFGVGFMRRADDWLAGAGVFRNSLGRTAGYAYVGKQWPIGSVLAGGIAGLTHRYNANHGGLVPLAAVVVTIPLSDRLNLDLAGIPRVRHDIYTTLNVSISWRFR